MSRKRMQRPARQTRRRRDAEAQCQLEFGEPARRGHSASDEPDAAASTTRSAASSATRHTVSPKGAKDYSPGQRPGNPANQSPSRLKFSVLEWRIKKWSKSLQTLAEPSGAPIRS